MKRKNTAIIVFLIALLCTNCAHWYNATDPKYPELIKASKPDHLGTALTENWKAWSYQSYPRSVSLVAPTGVMRFQKIDIYDIDSNGTFDTVFAQKDGKWRFGTTRKMRREYLMIDNGLSTKDVLGFINLANEIKRDIAHRVGQKPQEIKVKVPEKTLKNNSLQAPAPAPVSTPSIENKETIWYDLYNKKRVS